MSAQLCPAALAVEAADGVTVVRITDKELRGPDAQALGDRLCALVEQGHRDLHLDFGSVVYLESLVLGRLVTLYKKLRAVGGHLMVYNVDDELYEVFQVTNLTTLLDVRRKGSPDATA